MIFSELYGIYYQTVAAILSKAVIHPLKDAELRNIVAENAFGESGLSIPPALKEEQWQLLLSDGTTPVQHKPSLPVTLLEKRWLRAIALDPRIRLFGDLQLDFPDVEPLFTPEDIYVFDRYADGDPYEDEAYIANFRLILDAIRNRYSLAIETTDRRGNPLHGTILPETLEYSEKDDKFRLIGSGYRFGTTINLGRITCCQPAAQPIKMNQITHKPSESRFVEFELTDERNALERAMLHFAHFKKQAERIGEDRYKVTVYYDRADETEMVIRILYFGPLIKVTAPDHFIELIKQRLIDQKSCEQ